MANKAPKRRPSSWHIALLVALGLLSVWRLGACTVEGSSGGRSVSETVAGDYITVHFSEPPGGGIDEDLVALIDAAENRVDVAAYDLDLTSVTAALIRAQASGVAVRVVTDSENAGTPAIAQLRQAQVPIVARPAGGWGMMHNKFVVVDGTWVWTGSWNLTENGTFRNDNNAVVIASRSLAQNYAAEFEELFANRFGPSSPADTPHPIVNIEAEGQTVARVEVYFAPEDGAGAAIVDALSNAESTIHFLAFVFTSDPIAEALVDRVADGVTVTGVLEARSAQNPYSQHNRLASGGAEVLLDGNPYIMHHKVFIVDGETVILGSYNFSANAEEENDENVLIIRDTRVAAAFLAEFERIYQAAQRSGS
jgi:phosphatidylserine/phosphatidylglycerophosphate/cardiolipin synthase-like enzyme